LALFVNDEKDAKKDEEEEEDERAWVSHLSHSRKWWSLHSTFKSIYTVFSFAPFY